MAFNASKSGKYSAVITCGASVAALDRKAGEPMPIDNFFAAVKRFFETGHGASRKASGRQNAVTFTS